MTEKTEKYIENAASNLAEDINFFLGIIVGAGIAWLSAVVAKYLNCDVTEKDTFLLVLGVVIAVITVHTIVTTIKVKAYIEAQKDE